MAEEARKKTNEQRKKATAEENRVARLRGDKETVRYWCRQVPLPLLLGLLPMLHR